MGFHIAQNLLSEACRRECQSFSPRQATLPTCPRGQQLPQDAQEGPQSLNSSSSVQSTDYEAMMLKASSQSRRMCFDPCLSEHFEVDSFLSSSLIMDHECATVDLPDRSTGDRPRLYIPIGLETNLQLTEILRKRNY